jgi:hypothetical protein
VYIGWTILPSLANLRSLLNAVGLRDLAGRIGAADLRDHMVESWLWRDARYTLREVRRYGQYRVYEVSPPAT